MQKIQHTSLPWTVDRKFSKFREPYEIMANGYAIAVILAPLTMDDAIEEPPANAAYIVRACNVHYELLEALKAVKLFHYGCNWHHEDDCSLSCGGPVCDCGCDVVKEAIRKAESE